MPREYNGKVLTEEVKMHITRTTVKYSYTAILDLCHLAVGPSPGILIILQYLLCSMEGIVLIVPALWAPWVVNNAP